MIDAQKAAIVYEVGIRGGPKISNSRVDPAELLNVKPVRRSGNNQPPQLPGNHRNEKIGKAGQLRDWKKQVGTHADWAERTLPWPDGSVQKSLVFFELPPPTDPAPSTAGQRSS